MARILILREREAAAATARSVRAAGHEPVLLPLQEIVPLAPRLPEGRFGAILATSANALRGAALSPLRGLPVLAVGRASAAAAQAEGFSAEIAGDGTGPGLVRRATEIHARSGLALLYAAGRVRTDGLERALEDAGVPFHTVETYDTRDVDPAPDALASALERPVDAVLMLSLGQARAYRRLREAHPPRFSPPPVALCLSERIRAGLPEPEAGQALVPATPELSALLARYDSRCGTDR